MTITLEKVDFQVHIELNDNKEAVFSYKKNGEDVTGGGMVRTETAGTYTLDSSTVQQGFFFTGATITDKVGTCAQDFSHKLSDNRQAITITDTAENSGTACLIFNVECNGKAYKSADPQIINKDEN
ncbi:MULTISPECIES: DP-EP family protein [Pseudoalteromonas]|jgi:hypothetical protein|uniref:DP-EP family protein n=1 Tax=Pseudoalteromonas TaxID=53246 RepID=UPI0003FC54D6|nr:MULTISPECIES: DP-EP family protein [Pseudoalteromonas]MBE3672290.1 hypothetical protein [Pseudoalteromonas distincta KMM 3548]MDC3213278.1 DP-EP family protein [Pseudoalteromonas distincta]TVU76094.1 DP-EP family protein [Pseudoalteromonas elyakovii]|tara:strand:- start:134 stop:511 length:378 start_codon:yes stop_codon:yes gene_type:complete